MQSAVTLAQIARYAQVRRPSVSNWRRRHSDFPPPTGGTPAQPLFDAEQIAQWLDQRPTVVRGTESATYGDIFRAGLRTGDAGDGVELDGDTFAHLGLELVALRVAHQRPLPTERQVLADLCTATETTHPDLAGLFDQVHAGDHDIRPLLADVERLVSEVGAPGAAEEILSTARRRGWSGRLAETAPEICDLVAHIAAELLGKPSDLTVADLTAGPGRLLTTLSASVAPRTVHHAETDPAMAKVLRLRLFCHGHRNLVPHPDGQAASDFTGVDVALVDPPFQPGEHEQRDEHPLSWAARVVECLDGDGIGFAVVPEWTLTRAAIARRLPVTWTREQLIRRGCVRAIIQLPRHLHPFNSGADLALLVLNADDGDTTRQVVMCNATAVQARSDRQWVQRTAGLVCGPPSAHEGDLCRTFPVTDLVGRRSLLPAHLLTPESTAPDDHLRATIRTRESAISTFATSTDSLPVLQRITVTTRTAGTRRRTIGELLRGGQLIRLPGHRIPAGDLGDSGQRVLGREELLGVVPIGQRRIDVVNLGKYSAAAITEPGDVVIIAGEQLKVMVDDTGGSVLLTPAQGLRIPGFVKHSSVYRDEPQRAWIGPHALAALLGAARNAARTGTRIRSANLHQLEIPVLTSAEYDHLDETALLLTELAEQARRQAAALDLVTQQLATSLAAGALSLRLKPSTTTPTT